MKIIALAACVISLICQQSTPAPTANTLHDPLLDVTTLALSDYSSLSVEPGVRFVMKDDVLTFSTFDGAAIEMQTAKGRFSVLSPATGKVTADGIEINGVSHPKTSAFVARRLTQDDTDSNLKSMQENAKKLKSKNPPTNNNNPNQPNNNNQGNPVKHWRLLFSENPMATAELFNGPAIQQLSHMSPIGF